MNDSNDTPFGMGGLVISQSEQQQIDQDLEAFKQSLRHKKKKRKRNNDEQNNQSSKPQRRTHRIRSQKISALTYTNLLNRAYSKLRPGEQQIHGQKPIQSVSAPIVGLLPRKTLWANFQNICIELHRAPNHLKKFFESELVTSCNFNAAKQLMLRGRWSKSNIQSTLKRYIHQYVLCEDCSSLNTRMKRDNKQRLFELTCNDCTAHRHCRKIEKAFKTIANRRQRILQKQNDTK